MRARAAVGLALALAALGCEAPAASEDPSAAITPLDVPAAALERAGGEASAVAFDAPTLLHFWATWCAPCRRELPGLLRVAGEVEGVRVVAVTDEPWAAVRRHFAPRAVPPAVALDRPRVLANALGVGSLPETYVVGADGVARRRIAGARDWTRPSIRAWVASLARGDRR